ncbi:MAG: hypothetical protein RLZZ387_2600 [Chloroflexota bacterium]|jgi:hypothetical protein
MPGLIERLRGHAEIMERDKGKFVRFIDVGTCHQAADALEKLKGYAVHDDGCASGIVWPNPSPCDCGLTELLKELSDD